MRCVTIINQKGGCGKTTTAISLAGVFARRGLRTLLIDMDPQSHCAAGLAIPEKRIDLDIGDAMLADDLQQLDPGRLVWRASRNLDLAPSRMKLAGLEASRGGLAEKPDKERRLARVIDWLASSYDICCVDCSPSIGLLTYNAMIASTETVIPVETSYFSLQGAAKQVQTIRALEKRLGLSDPIWLLATIHDEHSPLAKDLLDELRRRFGDLVVPPVIRQDPRIKEAASYGQPICDYAPESPAARDYAAFADWLLSQPARGAALPAAAAPEEPAPAAPPAPVVRADAAQRFIDTSALRAPGAAVPVGAGTPASGGPERPLPDRAADVASLAARLGAAPQTIRAAALPTMAPVAPPIQPAPAPQAPMIAIDAPAPTPAPAAAPAAPALTEAERIVRANPGASGFGAHSVPGGVVFIQPRSAGEMVCVAGDFNGWSPTASPMRRNDRAGIHELFVALPAGPRHYRLMIDGSPSVDPFNRMVEMNPFGDPTSVAIAGPPPAPHAPHDPHDPHDRSD